MSNTHFNRHFLNPKETRNYLGNIFSDYTLRRSRSTGLLLGLPAPEYIKIAQKVCYDRADIDEWIERHAVRQRNTASS